MLYPARWKKITVDQSKVLKNQLFRFFWATRYRWTQSIWVGLNQYEVVLVFIFYWNIQQFNSFYFSF